jgi:hypothetical protein
MPISWPHPIDHGLVAGENRRHHVVEQAHVLPVLQRMAGVILGVFLGVSTGAEGPFAHSGEHHAVDVAGLRGGTERHDQALDHFRRVRIQLIRVVERDPDIEQPRHDRAVWQFRWPLLVAHSGLGEVLDEVVTLQFTHF